MSKSRTPEAPVPTGENTASRCRWLLAALVFLIVVQPFLVGSGLFGQIVVSVAFLAIVFAGVTALAEDRRHRRIVSSMSVLAVAGTLVKLFGDSQELWVHGVIVLTFGAYFGYVAWVLFVFVLRGRAEVGTLLTAALSVYLLVGICFAEAYVLVEILAASGGSSAFHGLSIGSGGDMGEVTLELTYFSFVTLTTLGFGDITPVGHYARTLTVVEAVLGVTYIATIVASLVGRPRPGSVDCG